MNLEYSHVRKDNLLKCLRFSPCHSFVLLPILQMRKMRLGRARRELKIGPDLVLCFHHLCLLVKGHCWNLRWENLSQNMSPPQLQYRWHLPSTIVSNAHTYFQRSTWGDGSNTFLIEKNWMLLKWTSLSGVSDFSEFLNVCSNTWL